MEHNLTDLYTKLGIQENGLHETRSILLNTSLSKVKAENDELRQSVRIADNELKIIGLREEVIPFNVIILQLNIEYTLLAIQKNKTIYDIIISCR